MERQDDSGGRPHIPVRRYGEVPPYPEELAELLADDSPAPAQRRRVRLLPLLLAFASASGLAAGARYFLHH